MDFVDKIINKISRTSKKQDTKGLFFQKNKLKSDVVNLQINEEI